MDEWDPVRLRAGLGYVLSNRIRIEAIYTAQFTRASRGSPLDYDNNIFQTLPNLLLHPQPDL